jgi:hypothetical protein
MFHASRRETGGGRSVAQREARRGPSAAADAMAESPRLVGQRRAIESAFGAAAQLSSAQEDEPLQGRFGVAQRVEEDEPLQGRFAVAQRVEEDEPLQGRFAIAQRAEEEEPLQGRFAVAQRAEEDEPLQGRFAPGAPLQAARSDEAEPNRTGLPDALKSGVEALSGMDLSDVRVHANSGQPAQLNALAYAQGNEIHLGPGQEQHLPHEAWHVVQQRQGRVQPTMQLAGTSVNDDAALETEADVMGAKALQAKVEPRAWPLADSAVAGAGSAAQLKVVDKALVNAEMGDSKAGDFGGLQASLFYTSKAYPHIHATEALLMNSGRGKKKKQVYMINDIHYSDGTKTFWWKDVGGTFAPAKGGVPTTSQKQLAEAFVNGWGAIA